jgi:hypothetical protein
MRNGWIAVVIAAALLVPSGAFAQEDVWRAFAQKLDPGTEVHVVLTNGQKFKAMLVDARADVVMLQPRTRVPVAVQPVGYGAIQSLRRVERGTSVAKAVGIGVGTGAAAFVAIFAILLASLD